MTPRRILQAVALLAFAAWAGFGTGVARAQDYEAGMAAYEAGDYDRAVRIWDPLATAGDATAQYSLGKIYETGNVDLQRDYGRAVEWYRLAAAQGVASAQNNLGLMYAQGRGVARDAGRAAQLWRSAADQNHPMAQFNLGLAYFRGEGKVEDKTEAQTWFRRAAELGLADAQYALGQIKLHGLTAPADKSEALAWYQLAAAQGHLKAREQAEILRQDGVKPQLASNTNEAKSEPQAPAASAAAGTAATPAEPAASSTVAPKATPKTAIVQPSKTQSTLADAPLKVDPPQATAPKTAAPKATLPKATAPKVPAPKAAAVQPAAPAKTAPQSAFQKPVQKPAAAQPAQVKSQIARAGAGAVPVRDGPVRAWLYTARSEGEAIKYLRDLESKNKPFLTGVDGSVTPVQLGQDGVMYRVVAGGFPTWQEGHKWCKLLRHNAPGTFCKVLPSRGAAN